MITESFIIFALGDSFFSFFKAGQKVLQVLLVLKKHHGTILALQMYYLYLYSSFGIMNIRNKFTVYDTEGSVVFCIARWMKICIWFPAVTERLQRTQDAAVSSGLANSSHTKVVSINPIHGFQTAL